MGVDFLDFQFRIERRFGLKIESADWKALGEFCLKDTKGKWCDITAGDLHHWVITLCQKRGMKVPHSSWNRVKLEIAKVCGISPREIRRDTRVKEELGFI